MMRRLNLVEPVPGREAESALCASPNLGSVDL